MLMAFTSPVFSQTLVEWPLAGNNYPVISSPGDLEAGNFDWGANIANLMYHPSARESPYASAYGWSTESAPDPDSYFEVCFNPKAGKTISITGLDFKIKSGTTAGGVLTGPTDFEVYWSLDGFVHSHLLHTGTSTAVGVSHHINWDKTLCDGQEICIRWYGYNATDNLSTWHFIQHSVRISGTVDAICTPPTTQGSAAITAITTSSAQVNITNGTGNRRLVLAKVGSPVDWMPCSGESFSANNQFGLGDEVGVENYVVYAGNATGAGTTTFSMTNLEQGRNYHIAVFEYNNSDNCFLQTNPARANFTTSCATASDVQSPMAYGFDGSVHLSWIAPYCFNDILVVAAENPITGTPSGNASNYTANGQYGMGSDSGNDFPAGEYPVYRGAGTSATITGLDNSKTYYFKIFARLGTSWSSGMEISSVSPSGCTELDGDVVFINELHYVNSGTDVNEGIEVFGPANVDLNGYQIHFYKHKTGGTNLQTFYKMINLSGIVDDEGNGYGAIWFDVPDIYDQVGAVCLYNSNTGKIVQFLSYRASMQVADDGIAMGLTADGMMTDVPDVAGENVGTLPGQSLQLKGVGTCPSDFVWEENVPETRGFLNDNQQILPIELLYFDAVVKDEVVEISWETTIERNNDYMVVQRSQDGVIFNDLQTVKGMGTTSAPTSYQIIDRHPLSGLSFYRLMQVDFDGTTVYHKVRSVFFDKGRDDIRIYPTIASQSITVDFNKAVTDKAMIYIFNINGQRLIAQSADFGATELNIPIAGLPKGVYFVNVLTNNIPKTFKIIKE